MSPGHRPKMVARTAIFAALWAVLEMTLGTLFKSLRLPLGGAIMAALAMTLVLSIRPWIACRGSLLMLGTLAALLRLLGSGGMFPGPVLAIFMEGLIAELLLGISGDKSWGVYITAVSGVFYSMIHPLISLSLFFGLDPLTHYQSLLRLLGNQLHLSILPMLALLAIYTLLHLLLGLSAAWLALRLRRLIPLH